MLPMVAESTTRLLSRFHQIFGPSWIGSYQNVLQTSRKPQSSQAKQRWSIRPGRSVPTSLCLTKRKTTAIVSALFAARKGR